MQRRESWPSRLRGSWRDDVGVAKDRESNRRVTFLFYLLLATARSILIRLSLDSITTFLKTINAMKRQARQVTRFKSTPPPAVEIRAPGRFQEGQLTSLMQLADWLNGSSRAGCFLRP